MLSAKQVEPGQSGQIEVSINTAGVAALNKTVSVSTDDPRQRLVRLAIKAVVQPEFLLSAKTIDFGNVPKGKEAARDMLITIPSERSVKVLSAASTDQDVAVRLDAVPSSGGKRVNLALVLKADAKDGRHIGMVRIKTTSAFTPELRILVRALVTS